MKILKIIYKVISIEKSVERTQASEIGNPLFKSSADIYKLGSLFRQFNLSASNFLYP